MAATYNLEGIVGDTMHLSFSVVGDYSTADFAMAIKNGNTTIAALAEGSGITKTVSGGSTYIVCLVDAATTATMSDDILYRYDLQVTEGTAVTTWLRGSVAMDGEVTA